MAEILITLTEKQVKLLTDELDYIRGTKKTMGVVEISGVFDPVSLIFNLIPNVEKK